jgi:L-galactose dehydrogenase/L-glyceraldehyde 3-phosphate reductase
MERRPLGSTGIEVCSLGFGCGAVGGLMVRGDRGEQVRAVARALDAGIDYFDTAPSYGDGASEQNLGRVLHELGMRGRVVVATKVRLQPADFAAPGDAVSRSLHSSLRRLGIDRVDLVHLHNAIGADDPGGDAVPLRAALEEVAEALQRAVDDGLVGHVGFTAIGETDAVKQVATHPAYETAQTYLNVLNPSGVRQGAAGAQQDFEGLITHAAAHGVGVIAIRVYAAGALTARLERHPVAHLPWRPLVPGSDYEDDVRRAGRLERTAAEFGMDSVLELGLRFALTAPGVATALVGLSTHEHLEKAIRWAGRGPLAADQFERVLATATAS